MLYHGINPNMIDSDHKRTALGAFIRAHREQLTAPSRSQPVVAHPAGGARN